MPAIKQQGMYKLTYMESGLSMAMPLGTTSASYIFRANSLFDPNNTGVGTQPYGYDQLCAADALFQNYKVFASKITIYCTPNLNTVRRLHVVVYPMRSALITGTYQNAIIVPGARTMVYDAVTEGTRGDRISNYVSIRKMYPESPMLADEGFYAASGGNPANAVYWICQVFKDPAEGALAYTTYFDVAIKFYAQMFRSSIPIPS